MAVDSLRTDWKGCRMSRRDRAGRGRSPIGGFLAYLTGASCGANRATVPDVLKWTLEVESIDRMNVSVGCACPASHPDEGSLTIDSRR
jgi:hypothetical protein